MIFVWPKYLFIFKNIILCLVLKYCFTMQGDLIYILIIFYIYLLKKKKMSMMNKPFNYANIVPNKVYAARPDGQEDIVPEISAGEDFFSNVALVYEYQERHGMIPDITELSTIAEEKQNQKNAEEDTDSVTEEMGRIEEPVSLTTSPFEEASNSIKYELVTG
ncbi:hypothetical protein RFI_34613 [Reticulomyxa filosa]|uniref:Uncharacterized protein n=1 Tax=Reticulomyxa filosa TaxID=46433 RepID=X6LNS6_RETFI|nr:hypothetical protein RFI_34613 [Reticulomyxa filosa]|eukprot:ETO02797.1 hypothetical protein RFI_34613 [Reticulomyxa filosa]